MIGAQAIHGLAVSLGIDLQFAAYLIALAFATNTASKMIVAP